MQALASSDVFLFKDFRLDRRGGGLFRRDDSNTFVPVAVGSRGLDILGVLITRAGETVSKDEIIAAVWPGIVVEDSNLTVQISALRRVLDQARPNGSCIQTVPGRGYRFVEAVTNPAAAAPSPPSPAPASVFADFGVELADRNAASPTGRRRCNGSGGRCDAGPCHRRVVAVADKEHCSRFENGRRKFRFAAPYRTAPVDRGAALHQFQ